jgi:hypothetical protein
MGGFQLMECCIPYLFLAVRFFEARLDRVRVRERVRSRVFLLYNGFPQSGLDKADLVYEILSEGEITRLVAVFHSQQPEVIGPVRSIRPYYVELGDGLDALIVHVGWSQDAMNMLVERKLPHFDEIYGDGASYWRDSTRKAPHNVYTSFEKIVQGAKRKRYRENWIAVTFPFLQEDDQVKGKPAENVTITYIRNYSVSYAYNEDKALYMRSIGTAPHMDKENGDQLSAANILIAYSSHRILDSEGRRAVDVNGPGKGYLLQQGVMQKMTWERKGDVIRAYADGKELPLLPGQTWIHVVPNDATVKIQ